MDSVFRLVKRKFGRMMRRAGDFAGDGLTWSWTAGLLALTVLCPGSWGAEVQAAGRFYEEIEPILAEHCYACHGLGMKKGGVAFDEFESAEALLGSRDLWGKVLRNLRAGLMPPAPRPRPSDQERQLLEQWIKADAFGIDPQDPDPGRVTLRRLNRVEYRNTIRDLMGIDFRADEEFPPDDTGYGFDNIGDVLTVSPLLLEKYMQAAESIVAAAVPTVSKVVPERSIPGAEFRGAAGAITGDRLTFYEAAQVSHAFTLEQAGDYRLVVDLDVAGDFFFDPGRCRVVIQVDHRERTRQEFAWHNDKRFRFEFEETWQPGEHRVAFELQPLTAADQKVNFLDLRIASVRVRGPLEERFRIRPENYDRFFSRDEPPQTDADRRRSAREVLGRFATKAFRRPVDDRTRERLVTIAEEVYHQPGKGFEDGVARAMVAVLASPRFLFRVEDADPKSPPGAHPFIDEYALASRLSYFLWSTMPDEELFRLAGRGELRKDLGPQVQRMLADRRSGEMVRDFVGQWLQVRDVDGIAINERVVLARDNGEEQELKREEEAFREFLANRQAQTVRPAPANGQGPGNPGPPGATRPAAGAGAAPANRQAQGNPLRSLFASRFPVLFRKPAVELDGELRQAMRRETEMFFSGIVREDRSVLELIDSDYTFVNERLARLYGIPGVTGRQMRRVRLPEGSPRGGVLTQGAVLAITSNPTRTSPVKRGQFILENLLGTPAPPPPPDIPDLEEAEKGFEDREPTMREVMAIHRSEPLCISCHARMDPLGLALENFNALGLWRQAERGQPIDAAGQLLTGESFRDVRELKQVLKDKHRQDFYRCLTEKLLTYALGRGLDDSDVHTVDQIVERLERQEGRFSALLMGIIESAPFQKRRDLPAGDAAGPPGRRAQPGSQS